MPTMEPLYIEINYDAQHEGFGDETDVPDARHVRVEIEHRKIKQKSLHLDPPPDAADPFCPIRIRPGSEQYLPDAVEFRAELDTDAIFRKWGFVEHVPKQEFPIVISAEVESKRSKAPKVTRDAIVNINLNSIRWKWQALIRDENGNEIEDGPEQENTPIEVNVDGTRQHGFRLTLERWTWEEPSYKQEEADFVHYLSPDHKLADMSVLALEPRPWSPEGKKNPRQITTKWWTQDLVPPNDKILETLPIETTIRVRAYPPHSIKEHRRDKRPVTVRDAGPLATREIPLRLGVRKWKAEVLSPNPAEPPVLLEGARPWEECVDVEFSLFDDFNPAARQHYKGKEVEWRLRPNRDGPGFCGTVSYGQEKGKTAGTWKTDSSGRVQFKFLPNKENALFLSGKNGFQSFAQFEVRFKGQKESKPFPPAGGPDDGKAPTLVFDWAPKFDLGAFKLPFFIKPEATLDVEPEPDPEKAEAIPLTLTEEEKIAYRKTFRTGGTIKLHPIVSWEAGGRAKEEFPLKHYRLAIGDNSRKPDEKRQIVPVDPASVNVRPETVMVPARPDASGTPSTVELKPKLALHPDMERILTRVVEQSEKLEEASIHSHAVAKQKFANPNANFHHLGRDFTYSAAAFFAETPEPTLVEKRKPLFFTLTEIPKFLFSTRMTWSSLNASIDFHRKAYKRLEEGLITFYFDFIQWSPVKDIIKNAWRKLKDKTVLAKWIEPAGYAPGVSKVGAILREGNERMHDGGIYWFIRTCKEPFDKALEKLIQPMQRCVVNIAGLSGQRQTAMTALATARTKLNATVSEFSRHADDYVELMKRIGEQAKAGLAMGKDKQQVAEELRELLTQAATLKASLLKARTELRSQLTGSGPTTFFDAAKQVMQADYHLMQWKARKRFLEEISKHYNEGSKELGQLLKTKMSDVGGEKAILQVVKKFEKMPKEFQDVMEGMRHEGQRFIDSNRDEVIAAGNTILAKVQALQKYRNQLDLPELPPGASRVNPGREWASALDNLALFEDEIPRHSAAVREFTQTVKGFLDKKLIAQHATWAEYRMLVDQVLKDGLKKGGQRLSKPIRETLDLEEPAPLTMPDASIVGRAGEMARGALLWLAEALANLVSYAFSVVLWLLKLVGRILLTILNTFFRIIERLLAKVFEAIVSSYEWVLTTDAGRLSLSALKREAWESGAANFALGDFFNLPYSRDLKHLKMMEQAKEQYYNTKENDSDLDQALQTGLRTGYEDYYPSQVTRARDLLFELCNRLLNPDKRILTSPPCDEVCKDRATLVARTIDQLEKRILEYVATEADHKALAQKGMWMPLWDLTGKAWQNKWMNALALERLVDWIGWCLAWSFRLLAAILAIFVWWSGPVGAVSVIGLLTSASMFSALSAVARTTIGVLGFYPYSVSWPRDVLLLQGVYFSMVFRPAGERFEATAENEILSR